MEITQNDSVISGDIVSNTVIHNDPKAVLEMFFAFQKEFTQEDTPKIHTSEDTIELSMSAVIFESILENYSKIGAGNFSLFFDESHMYSIGVDPSHVIMISVSTDPEKMLHDLMENNSISVNTKMYREVFRHEMETTATLTKKKSLFTISQGSTVLQRPITRDVVPRTPAIQFPMPPVEIENSVLVKAIAKLNLSGDELFYIRVDKNGDLSVRSNPNIQHLKKLPITNEFLGLPLESIYSWNYIGPLLEANYNSTSYIQFGNDFPLGFLFRKNGCNFCGYLAPRVPTSDTKPSVVSNEVKVDADGVEWYQGDDQIWYYRKPAEDNWQKYHG
jgi:hypothetical protein